MVLYRHLGELLEGGAVLARVLHAGFREHGRHGAGAQEALLGNAGAAAGPAQQTLAHLLDAYGENAVVKPGLDGCPGFPEGSGAGGAGVGDVDDGYARLADLLQDALADHAAGLTQVAAVKRLHVLDGEPAIV
jgi:hypothetical protein